MKLNTIAIDDEPLALEFLTNFCLKTPQVNLVDAFDNAVEALQRLQHEKQTIHLIFLDISMPDLDGMNMAGLIRRDISSPWPRIVFVSAHKEYAIQSFEVDALHYITKPYSYGDFMKVINKAIDYVKMVESFSKISKKETENFMIVRVEHRILKVFYRDIIYVESFKDYVKFHMQHDSETFMCIDSLKHLEATLPNNFMRIHRSHIVNLDKVTALNRNSIFFGKLELPVSEQYRESYSTFMSGWIG